MGDKAILPKPNGSRQVFVFHFEDSDLRAVPGDDNEPCFIAADACKALDISNVSMAVTRLDDDEKGVTTIDTLGGPQQVVTVTESGLYSLILTSRKPEAKAFKRWVTHKVLPSIRKTGRYELRLTERQTYQHVRDCIALSTDYDPHSETCREYFATIQNKIYFAITGQTAAELLVSRADHDRPNMGLQTWDHEGIRKSDVVTAKNYLTPDELRLHDKLNNAVLTMAEVITERGTPTTMNQWIEAVNHQILAYRMDILHSHGSISHEQAKAIASREYEQFCKLLKGGK